LLKNNIYLNLSRKKEQILKMQTSVDSFTESDEEEEMDEDPDERYQMDQENEPLWDYAKVGRIFQETRSFFYLTNIFFAFSHVYEYKIF